MNSSSRSTELLNCIVALSTKTPDFPYPLWENGFQIENLEPRILLSDGSQSKPDIQLKKHDDHITFFECKDGHCEKDQLNRYKSMSIDDIKRTHVTSLSSANLTFDLAYFGTKEKEEKLVTSIEKDQNPFPIVILEKNKISLSGKNTFKNPLLNSIFNGITFDKPIPQSFIPFTPDDDAITIKTALLQFLVTKSGQTFTLDDLINELFDHVINLYSREGKDELKWRIGNLLTELRKDPELSEFVSLSSGKYSVKDKSFIKFRNICNRLIEGYRTEQNKQKQSLWQYID